MKKLLFISIISFLAVTSMMAQGLKIIDFKLLESDLTATTHGTSKTDQNGETAALIKIVTPERGFIFDGGSLGIVATEEHAGEIWLYVPRRAQKLIVRHPLFGVNRDYFYPIPVEGARTYEMLIDIGTGRYTTITSEVAKSEIYIDGEPCGEAPIYNKYLNYGRHIIRAAKDRHEGSDTIYITTNDDEKTRVIPIAMRDMSDHFGNVNISVEKNAEIWFEGKRMGIGSWQTQLREGSYVVETRKVDCDPEKTSFTVVAQQQNNISAAPPTPWTGRLRIFTRPDNVQATYNGTSTIDLSESHTLPIGTYQLEMQKRGYISQNHEYTVVRNQTTVDTVKLEKIKYIKPKAFYFGAGYSLRSLGGISALAGIVFKRHDLQLSYTFGISASDDVHWYSTDGLDTYLSSISYKRSTFAVKYGYQFELTNRLGLTPQVGYTIERLSGTVNTGTNLFGDKASASCLSIGAKLLYAPIQRLYLFAAPEVSFAVQKDYNFKNIADASDISAGGFQTTIGVIFNF